MYAEISIDGKKYPMADNMGAARLFKKTTGREISEIKETEVSAQAEFLWCCAVSECRRRGIDFPYDVDQFCDSLTPTMLAQILTAGSHEAEVSEKGETQKGKKKR